tara:strand:- start:918 stop:1346 length:429 start_codon:yes stop_codon:yes gene_type:complete
MKYYFAYGSNLNHDHMKFRCPDSKFVGTMTLSGWELVFRSVADISENKDKEVKGGLYSITEKCEAALDIYEGFPHLYNKGYMNVNLDGKEKEVMTYIMNDRSYLYGPSKSYLETIVQGYLDCKLPLDQLENAVIKSKGVNYE